MKFSAILCCCLIAIIADERTSFVDSLPSRSFNRRDFPDEHLILDPEETGFGSVEDSFEVTAYDDLDDESRKIRIRRQEVDEEGDDDDADDDSAPEAETETDNYDTPEVETEAEVDNDDDESDSETDEELPAEELPAEAPETAESDSNQEEGQQEVVEEEIVPETYAKLGETEEEPVVTEEVVPEEVPATEDEVPAAEEEAPPAEEASVDETIVPEEVPPTEDEVPSVEDVVAETVPEDVRTTDEEAAASEVEETPQEETSETVTESSVEESPEIVATEASLGVEEQSLVVTEESAAAVEETPDAAEGETPVEETLAVVTESPDTVLEEVVPTEAAELDEVEKLLFPASEEVGPTTPLPECAGSKFGCCPDGKTAAHGPRSEGCCLSSQFGCCNNDLRTPASGPDQAGCNCTLTEFGCCPDSSKSATGPNNEGCGCSFAPHGCCPDQVSAATGPDLEGCLCPSHDYGCCPDGVTVAQGPKLEGCAGCEVSEHGCCEDGFTPASGPDSQGCGCAGSKSGCCPDGAKNAEGPAFEGCGEIPGESCFLTKDAGTCKENFSVRWFFDIEYGGCSRFWYAQCKDSDESKAGNRFSDLDSCEKMCVKPPGSGRCFLPKVRGPCEAAIPSWYFDKQWNQCMPFDYGGCLGNANRFETKQACQESCIHSEDVAVCSQPLEPGPCRGEYPRFYYDDEKGVCKSFNYTGCKGNSNRFSTLESCENSCKHHSLLITAKRRCSLPKKAGSPQCTKREAKWFFDTKAKGCRPFIFSGCDGNENSFDSVEECEQACPNAFPPEIEVITKLVIAEEGNEAILQVKVEANPPPTVWWQFEDVKVEYSDRISKLMDGSLRIGSAEMNDTGSWTIIADNRLGQVARKQVALKVHPNQMPIEVTIPKDKNVFRYGKDITLSCQVKGYPIPVIRWYKNNTPVPKSSRISISDDNTLTISKSSSIDGGSYSCRATNEHESVSDKIDIKVEKVQTAKECTDKPAFAKCELIVRANFCNKNPYYAEFCCQSCTSAGQLTQP